MSLHVRLEAGAMRHAVHNDPRSDGGGSVACAGNLRLCPRRPPPCLPAVVAFSCLIALGGNGAVAAPQVDGSADFGVWYLHNDLKDNPLIQIDDVARNTYIHSRYTLFQTGLKLDATDLWQREDDLKLNSHFRGRLLWNPDRHAYTLGPADRVRDQISDLNIQLENLAEQTDLWLGRQTIWEAGNPIVDGVRAVYKIEDDLDLALYGGLGGSPNNLTGYIGPFYRTNPFTLDFQTVGAYATYHGTAWKLTAAFRTDLFKGSLDRGTFFTQGFYPLSTKWSVAGLVEYDVAGKPGLKNGEVFLTSRPTATVTNTFSLARWSTVAYKESNASAIPVLAEVDPAPVGGNEVDTSSYNVVRNHIMLRLFQRNYVFGAFAFTRRTFDDRNQLKYTAGYRNPNLFGSNIDARFQLDVIDNFRGFNTAFDTLFGRDFLEGRWRLEGGGSMFADERDAYLNFQRDPTQPREADNEYALRLNAYFNPSRTLTWVLNYAFYREVDVINARQKVHTHDVYLGTHVKF
ncbi:MAG: hypothetical protein V1798_09170 [Pseudomonadota bacterium]